MGLIVKFPKERRLLDEIPFPSMSPSQDLHQSFFFFAFPDLRHHRVPPTALHGLHPQVAIDQDPGAHPLPQGDHRDDLPKALDGTGQRRNPLRPMNPGMGIAKLKMSDLDLFHFSKMTRIHDPLSAPRSIRASTRKSIYDPTFTPTKMTTLPPLQPCATRNQKNRGATKKFYKPQGQPRGRGIIHLFFILFIFFTYPVSRKAGFSPCR